MWLVTLCAISIYICCSLVHGQITSTSGGQHATVSGVKEESSASTLTKRSCFVSSPSSGIPPALPEDQLNPRYTRSILAANKRVKQNPDVEKLRFPREIQPGECNQESIYSRLAPAAQQNAFSPRGNFGYYRRSVEEPKDQDSESRQQQDYTRPLYPTYDESFVPPNPQQGQRPAINVNKAIPQTPAFHVRNCPYCNSPLPPGHVYQHQQMSPGRSNQFQQSHQPPANQFNQPELQQYPMHHGQVAYQNVNPAVKTTPTTPTEEVCPYSSGGGEDDQMSSITGYNQTLPQSPDIRRPLVDERYPPSIVNNPSYLEAKNLQTFPRGPVTPKIIKAGTPSHQPSKYMKIQRTDEERQGYDGNA